MPLGKCLLFKNGHYNAVSTDGSELGGRNSKNINAIALSPVIFVLTLQRSSYPEYIFSHQLLTIS